MLPALKQLAALILALTLGFSHAACACLPASSASAAEFAAHATAQPHHPQGHQHAFESVASVHLHHGDTSEAGEDGGCVHEPSACEAGHQSPAVAPASTTVHMAVVQDPADLAVFSPIDTLKTGHFPDSSHAFAQVPRPPPRATPVMLKTRFLN